MRNIIQDFIRLYRGHVLQYSDTAVNIDDDWTVVFSREADLVHITVVDEGGVIMQEGAAEGVIAAEVVTDWLRENHPAL